MKNNFFELDELKSIEFDITSYCNSGCPVCVRHKWGTSDLIDEIELSHLDKKVIFNIIDDVGPSVKIHLNGVLGDALMHPDILDIVQYIDSKGNWINIETNGGSRNEKLWAELGKFEKLSVQFSIDGLADTNFIYRIKTNFDKIISNAKAFINAGGIAHWKFIVFNHNQHQIEEAKQLAEDIGFKKFTVLDSFRFLEPQYVIDRKYYKYNKEADNQDYIISPSDKVKEQLSKFLIKNIQTAEKSRIDCKSIHRKDMFVSHDGNVWPCCFFESFKHKQDFKDLYKSATDLYGLGFNNLYKNSSFKDIFYSDFFQQFLHKNWNTLGRLPNKICQTKCGKEVKGNDWKTTSNKSADKIG